MNKTIRLALLGASILALASPEKRHDIAEILASISNDGITVDEIDRDFGAAERLVQLMHDILEDTERSMIVGRSYQKQPTIEERIRAHRCLPADSGSLQPSGAAISLFAPAILTKCPPRNGLPAHAIVKNVGRGSR